MVAHIHEKIDFTVSIFVVFQDKVLLHQHRKYNIWLPVGGHIELDEDPNQAALREVKEEAGLEVKLVGHEKSGFTDHPQYVDLIPPRFLNKHFTDAEHQHVDFIYFAEASTDAVVPEEGGGEMRWFTKVELEANEAGIKEDVRVYALAALKELSR